MKNEMKREGWIECSPGYYPSNGSIKEIKDIELWTRSRRLDDVIECDDAGNFSHFGDFASISCIRSDEEHLVISFEAANWGQDPQTQAWSFASIIGDADGRRIVEFVFIKTGKRDPGLEYFIGRILDLLGIYNAVDKRAVVMHEACVDFRDGKPIIKRFVSYQDAKKNAKYIYRNKRFENILIESMPDKYKKWNQRDWSYFREKAVDTSNEKQIILAGHGLLPSLMTLDQGDNRKPLLRFCVQVHDGIFTTRSYKLLPKSSKERNNNHNTYVYQANIIIRDSRCHVSDGAKEYGDMAKTLRLRDAEVLNMDECSEQDLVKETMKASAHCLTSLLYLAAIYGINKEIPCTLPSASAKIISGHIHEYLGLEQNDKKGYDRLYRGMEEVRDGKTKAETASGYVQKKHYQAISADAEVVQCYARHAYLGGLNSCNEVGYYPIETYDYDLKNAYPTAMSLLPDIDWENPIEAEIFEKELSLDGWDGDPLKPFLGYISFDFPAGVRYPCIPMHVDGKIIFVRKSDKYMYASGAEIYLALKLGARIYCQRGYFLRVRRNADGVSHALRAAVYPLVRDRKIAAEKYGNKSIEQTMLKYVVNYGYGKVSQNVIEKSFWDAYANAMREGKASDITEPVMAALTTALVRAVLNAVQIQIFDRGYHVYSVTTDGFISDIPEEELVKLDMFGFRPLLEEARLFLTDNEDPEIWSRKHQQCDLLNFTTRGNVSLEEGGVCAHAGCQSGYDKDSYADRLWMAEKVVSRTGRIRCEFVGKTSLKDILKNKVRYSEFPKVAEHSLDYDLKRKPVLESMHNVEVTVAGKRYEIANFETVPFETEEEYAKYANAAKKLPVLRTKEDWQKFVLRLYGLRSDNLEWEILWACVISGILQQPYNPTLEDLCGQERLDYINRHNYSGRVFKPSDWNNAKRAGRQRLELPFDMYEDRLYEMLNDPGTVD